MIKRILAIGMVGSFMLFSASAFAVTPGNLSLKNVAKLTYTGNAAGIEAEATVRVNVIASQPTLSAVADITKAENQAITTSAQYTVTATNNGLDTYNFVPSTLTSGSGLTDVANTDFTGVSYIYKDANDATITNVVLGATAFNAEFTNATSITVPSDGVADDEVNGIKNGDTVVINGEVRTINAVVSDTGSGSVTLSLSSALTTGTLALGTGVFERKIFTAQTNGAGGVGNQTVDGAATSYDVTTTLTSTLEVPLQVSAADTFRVTIINVSIVKYVRNTTRPNCDDGTPGCTADANHDSGSGVQDFYRTDGSNVVNARPGEELEYLLRVNVPASGTLDTAAISDVLAQFTSYVPATLRMNSAAVNDEGAGGNSNDNSFTGTFPLDPAADDGGLLIMTGAPAGGDEGTGSVTGGSEVNVVYKVVLSNL